MFLLNSSRHLRYFSPIGTPYSSKFASYISYVISEPMVVTFLIREEVGGGLRVDAVGTRFKSCLVAYSLFFSFNSLRTFTRTPFSLLNLPIYWSLGCLSDLIFI